MGKMAIESMGIQIVGRIAKRFHRMVCLWRNAPLGLPPYADCALRLRYVEPVLSLSKDSGQAYLQPTKKSLKK